MKDGANNMDNEPATILIELETAVELDRLGYGNSLEVKVSELVKWACHLEGRLNDMTRTAIGLKQERDEINEVREKYMDVVDRLEFADDADFADMGRPLWTQYKLKGNQ